MKRGLLMLAAAAAMLTALPAPAGARSLDGCRPLRALFYAASGSLGLAQALAANASPCAEYYVSVPPLTADKTQMRSGTAGSIRALGPAFHALAEVNVTAWQGWVTSTGGSWYQAGVEARRRMAAAGFDVAAGDTWAVNELSSAVRVGTGTSRQNLRDLVHGLYDGDGGPPAKGVVFVTGIAQPTTSLDTYKARLESWLQDAGFWGDMSAYVSDYLQESYGDVRDYAVAGSDVPTRLGYLNAYLEHVLDLVRSGPASAAPAAGYLAASYAALANAAWAWTSGFGFTAVSSEVMDDYVSAQLAAMRAFDASLGWSADRIGFAWDPSNSLGLSSADFDTQLAAIQARLAAALAADDACAAPSCTASVDGAAFTSAWGAFSTWTPTAPAFASPPQAITAGTASGPMSVQLQIGPIASPLPFDTTVTLSSSSPGGSFSTSSTGPWTPTLALTVPAGTPSAAFYMLDSQPGTPTVTASLGGVTATQVEAVNPPAAPLVVGNGGNTTTYVLGGAPVVIDPALTVSDAASPTLASASVTVTSGLDPGDVLSAAPPQGVTAAYANGTLTLSGTAPVTSYQAALRSVVFSGTTATGGTRSVLWTVADGSTTASAVSTIAYTAPPGAPTGVSAAAGNGQATVTFGAPASDGGTPITVYTVTAQPGGATATDTNSPITVGGLASGTGYTFTVTASNAAGTGPASTPSNAVVPSGGGGGGGGAALPPPTVSSPASAPSAPATPPQTVPPPRLTPPLPRRLPAVTVAVSPLRSVTLGRKHPSIAFTVRASGPARLVATLRDARGKTLATWRRTLKRGAQKLSLPLAPRVRHAGTRRLRLVWTRGGSRTLSVTLKR